jgi:hypothetical protein
MKSQDYKTKACNIAKFEDCIYAAINTINPDFLFFNKTDQDGMTLAISLHKFQYCHQ